MVNVVNNYPGLSGVKLAFDENGKFIARDKSTSAKTGSLLILGTATDGPVGQPVSVNDSNIDIFGTGLNSAGYQDGSTLRKSYAVAKAIGCEDIRLMRISGRNAKCSIEADSTTEEEKNRMDESAGSNIGNAKSEFTLTGTNIDPSSVVVYCDGVQLINGATYDSDTNKVTIQAGITSANKNVSISYNYNKIENVKDNFTFDITNNKMIDNVENPTKAVFELTNIQSTSDYKVYINGVELDSSKFTVDTLQAVEQGTPRTIVRLQIPLKDGENDIITTGDKVLVKYKALTDTLYSDDENSNTSGPFMTMADTMSVELTHTPIKESIKLYANNIPCKKQVFTYSEDTKTVTFSTDVSDFGADLVISYVYVTNSTVDNTLEFESYFGGTVYNLGYIQVEEIKNTSNEVIGKKITINKPESKTNSLEKPYSYTSLSYPTLGVLVDAINRDSNGIYRAYTLADDVNTINLKTGTTYFSNGADGVNISKEELYKSLSGEKDENGYCSEEYPGTYTLIRDYMVDNVVLTGAYADTVLLDKEHDFGYDLCLYTSFINNIGSYCRGYINFTPCKDISLSGVQRYGAKLSQIYNYYIAKNTNGEPIMSNGTYLDIGKHIATFGGPEAVFVDDSLGTIYAEPALVAAAFDTTLQPQQNINCKSIPNCVGLRYEIGMVTLSLLKNNNINSLHTVTEKNGKVTYEFESGKTCAYVCYGDDGKINKDKSSAFVTIAATDVVRYVVDQIRPIAKQYRGSSFPLALQNACINQIEKKLNEIKEKGIVENYGFVQFVDADEYEANMVNLKIELSLKITGELKDITIIAGLMD